MKQEYCQSLKLSVMKALGRFHPVGRVFLNPGTISIQQLTAIEKSLGYVGSLMDFLLSMNSH